MNLQPYLDFARQLAYEAGKLTLEYFDKGIRHDMKADETPVTAADRAAEEFIRRAIEQKYPSHAIVGEEFGEKAGEGNPFRWIIDPIDGTKSFIKGVPLYSVLIGLEIEGVSRVGAACFPALDKILYAADGLGAWCNETRVHVSEISEMRKAVFTFTSWSGFRTRTRLDVFESLHRACFIGRGWGDAYGIYLVATGRAEIHIEPSVALWDVAPFPPIFREAGGYFGSWSGDEGHTHGEALAINAALAPKVLELTRRV
jgi:myo-inositol-1(or 4)-monophosphatase